MQATINIHLSDLEFRLRRVDPCHIISDDDNVTVFLPIGLDLKISLRDWLAVSRLVAHEPHTSYIGCTINDKVHGKKSVTHLRVSLDRESVNLGLKETLAAEISVADWRRVADRIIFDLVSL